MSDTVFTATSEQIHAIIYGVDVEEYRMIKAERNRIDEIALQYINKRKKYWPTIQFNWDLSRDSMRYSLDGVKQAEFEKQYRNGFLLGFVSRKAFHNKLCKFSRRDGARELWSLGDKMKLARCIARLSEGQKISPPLVKPTLGGELILAGGHHRYAVANACKLEELPIYCEPQYVTDISSIVSVRWST